VTAFPFIYLCNCKLFCHVIIFIVSKDVRSVRIVKYKMLVAQY